MKHYYEETETNQGRRHEGGLGEQSPIFVTKVIFVNRLKLLRKYWGYGGDVTNHT